MADLGVIRTVDANTGIRPVTGAPLANAVGNALNRTSEVLETAAVDSFENEANDILAESNVPEVIEPEVGLELAPDQKGPPTGVTDVMRSIDRNLRAINRGSVSQADLAKLRLTQSLNRAKNKYPFYAAQLDARAGQVASSSPDLAEIALGDATRATASSIAKAEYLAVTKHARDDLHIDPALEPGSAEFNRQYTHKQDLYQKQQTADSELRLIMSVDERTTAETAKLYLPALQGEASSTGVRVLEMLDAPGGFLEYRAELSKLPHQQNSAIIDQWGIVGVHTLEENVAGEIFMLQDAFNALFKAGMRQGPAYQAAKAQLDSWVEQLNGLVAAPTKTEDLQTYAEVQAVYAKSRVRTLVNSNPSTLQVDDFYAYNGGAENYIRAANMSYSGNALQQNKLATAAQGAIETFFLTPPTTGVDDPSPTSATIATYEVTGQGLITPNMTPQEVTGLLIQHQKEGSTILPKATETEEELILEAAKHFKYSQEVFANLKEIDPNYSSSGAAGGSLTQATSALLAMSHVGRPAKDQQQFLVNSFADVELLEAIQVAGDGDDRNRRLAFGSAAQDMYAMTRPSDRRADTLEAYNTKYRGAALSEYLNVKIEEGGLYSFTVDKARIKQLIENETEGKFTISNPNAVKSATDEVTKRAQLIFDQANKDIMAETHIAVASQPSVEGEVSYYRLNDELGWMDGLMK